MKCPICKEDIPNLKPIKSIEYGFVYHKCPKCDCVVGVTD